MQITDGDGVQLYQSFYNPFTPPPPLPAPHYFVCDNHITATGYGGGMILEDDSMVEPTRPPRCHHLRQHIHLDNNGKDAGISGFWVNGTQVLDNRIWGDWHAGIDVGAGFLGRRHACTATGWLIIGNDVSGVSPVDYSMRRAHRPDLARSRCRPLPGRRRQAPTTVLDQGTRTYSSTSTR